MDGNIIVMGHAGAHKPDIHPDVARQDKIDKRLILAQQLSNKIQRRPIISYKNVNPKASTVQFNRFVKGIIEEAPKILPADKARGRMQSLEGILELLQENKEGR